MQNRVYITSYSMISSLGCDAAETKSSLESGQQRFVKDVTCDFPYPHFAQNRFADDNPLAKGSKFCLKLLDNIKSSIINLKNVPVFLASSTGAIVETELRYADMGSYPLMKKHFYNTIINDISAAYPNLHTSMTFSTACSSSGHGVYQAYKYMQAGVIKKALIIGYDVLSWTTNVGFDSLKLVSHNGTKPMTLERDGLSLGDGAGVVLLETDPTVEPIAEIVGIDSNSDGYHISSPAPDGAQQISCMVNAMDMAGVKPTDIDYVCAHGTGTVMNDEIEIKALKTVFDKNDKLKVSSLKSFIGHTLGASAVLELAISLMALKDNKIYQVSNLGTVIDERLVPQQTITHQVKYFFNNAFGFGGNNVAMLVKML